RIKSPFFPRGCTALQNTARFGGKIAHFLRKSRVRLPQHTKEPDMEPILHHFWGVNLPFLDPCIAFSRTFPHVGLGPGERDWVPNSVPSQPVRSRHRLGFGSDPSPRSRC